MDRKKGLLFGSFVGDALSLGVHWVYNTRAIDKKIGTVEEFIDPIVKKFHPNRKKGEFTHYGDQTILLLENIARAGHFSGESFFIDWLNFMSSYDGYMDHATKDTLARYTEHHDRETAASSSDELGGAARIAPLIYTYANEPDLCVRYAEEQTQLTHNNREPIESAQFFSRAVIEVLRGSPPRNAIKKAGKDLSSDSPLQPLLTAALESIGKDTRDTIGAFGQACHTKMAFPATIHLILSYENDFRTALIQNVQAGGDSATRGLLTGMVLGAHLGMESIPDSWLHDLKSKDRIVSLADTIDTRYPSG